MRQPCLHLLGGKLVREESKRQRSEEIDHEMAKEVEPLAGSQGQAECELREQGRADRQVGPGKPGAVGVGEPMGAIEDTLGHDQADEQEDQPEHRGLDGLDEARPQQVLKPQRQQLLLPFTPHRSLQPLEIANLAADPFPRLVFVVFFLKHALATAIDRFGRRLALGRGLRSRRDR